MERQSSSSSKKKKKISTTRTSKTKKSIHEKNKSNNGNNDVLSQPTVGKDDDEKKVVEVDQQQQQVIVNDPNLNVLDNDENENMNVYPKKTHPHYSSSSFSCSASSSSSSSSLSDSSLTLCGNLTSSWKNTSSPTRRRMLPTSRKSKSKGSSLRNLECLDNVVRSISYVFDIDYHLRTTAMNPTLETSPLHHPNELDQKQQASILDYDDHDHGNIMPSDFTDEEQNTIHTEDDYDDQSTFTNNTKNDNNGDDDDDTEIVTFVQDENLEKSLEKMETKKKDRRALLEEWKQKKQKQQQQTKLATSSVNAKNPKIMRQKSPRVHNNNMPRRKSDKRNTKEKTPPKLNKMNRHNKPSKQTRNTERSHSSRKKQSTKTDITQDDYKHPSSFFSFFTTTESKNENNNNNGKQENNNDSTATEREAASLALAQNLKKQYTEVNQTLISTKRDLNQMCMQNFQYQNQIKSLNEQKQLLHQNYYIALDKVKEYDAVVAHSEALQSDIKSRKENEKTKQEEMRQTYEKQIQDLQFQFRIMKQKLKMDLKFHQNQPSSDDEKKSYDNKDTNNDNINNQSNEEKHDNLTGSSLSIDDIENLTYTTDVDNVKDPCILYAMLEERNEQIKNYQQKLLANEQLRRDMHNEIQELRGNIRVYVRLRPFLKMSDTSNDEVKSDSVNDLKINTDDEALSPIMIDEDQNTVTVSNQRANQAQDRFDFKFDKVFGPTSTQDDVFNQVTDFVQSAMDGYNVCLFSYGQTGSGKTHTMQGYGTDSMRGIIPRSVEQILIQANSKQETAWEYELHASFLEIYNETLKDLLLDLQASNHAISNEECSIASGDSIGSLIDEKKSKKSKLMIRKDDGGRTYVQGLSRIKIDCNSIPCGMEQLKSIIEVASRARSVATTKMNSMSSRSHSIFILDIKGKDKESGVNVFGSLNLCDLAGSERLSRTSPNESEDKKNNSKEGKQKEKTLLKETQSINKSLSSLGGIFSALASNASHVPYRNSKLTYLLQDCLGGDGKSIMFVNLSPTVESCGETLCSLRFAQRVSQIELGKATIRQTTQKN